MLPERKQDYVRERIAGKNKMQAALAAGYAPNTARQALENIETDDVKAVLRRAVQRAIGQETIARKIAEGINATNTEFAKHEGKITDSRDVVAWSERRAYLAMAAEYAGYVEKDAPSLSLQVGSLSICNAGAPATTTTDTTTTTPVPASLASPAPVIDVESSASPASPAS